MNVVVVTGSRADRAPLTPVVEALGAEWLAIPPMLGTTGIPFDSAIACSEATKFVAYNLYDKEVDYVVVLGDRFEILGAATAAYLLKIPVAHLSGGDITEGSQDDGMRHAITKLSHLHFATNYRSAERLKAMGEQEWRLFSVGCPGIDALLRVKPYSRPDTCSLLDVPDQFVLVAYQAPTLAEHPASEVHAMLDALDTVYLPLVFCTVNPDAYGKAIETTFRVVANSGKGRVVDMDHRLFVSAMKHCAFMIGNSSAGLYEAPSLSTPFVNVGERQRGRLRARSVFDAVDNKVSGIQDAIERARRFAKGTPVVNPYGDGKSAQRIARILGQFKGQRQKLLLKQWSAQWHSINPGTEFTASVPGEHIPQSLLSAGS